ncbi:fatty acid synthase-like [Tetranychus urticae]|nr:fatty acid synthase-like [Tetranychus urticae]
MLTKNDENVIISGVSGRFPKSDSVEELWQNLFSGKPLYGPDTVPYPKIFSRLPKSRGYLKDTRLFDNTFFNYTVAESNTLDPQIRILLEVVYEALWDAGIKPQEWRGTRTGFFLGSAFDDTGLTVRWDYKINLPQYFAQRVSYHYDWRGPTMIVDTACAASLNALHTAYWSIKNGECDQAVVAGIALHVKPSITICFAELEMLSKSGQSWCLDEKADGYIRSEAIVAVVLQKSKTAKRIYASILNSCTSSDGYTKEGITFPRKEVQVETMKQTLRKSGLNPLDINYVEAHITGTSAGDPIEASAIMEAYRGNSEHPLMLGCLKSNIGHSEASAGLCALAKVIKIFQTQLIPPNINMINCNPRIESLREGRLKPVVKPTIFTDQIISIDAFGFGGSNTHVILKGPRDKLSPVNVLSSPSKTIKSQPLKQATSSLTLSKSLSAVLPSGLPRLVFFCNRTKKGLNKMIETIERNVDKLSNGYLSLLTNLGYSEPETGLNHRAFCLLGSSPKVKSESSELLDNRSKPLIFLFDDSFSNLSVCLTDLPLLSDFVKKTKLFLQNIKTNGTEIGYNDKSQSLDTVLDLFLRQLTLAFFLKSLEIKPSLIIGTGIGKISAKYAAGQITWQEALTSVVHLNGKAFGSNGIDNSPIIDQNGYLKDLFKLVKTQSISCSPNNCKSFANDDYYFHVNQKYRDTIESLKLQDCFLVRINNNLNSFYLSEVKSINSFSNQSNIEHLLIKIGNIYLNGHNPKIDTIYPVDYPVESDCPSIGHLLSWKHELSFDNVVYPEFFRDSFRTAHRIDLVDSNYSDLSDYIVDGSITLPTAGYIWMVWDHLVKMRCSDQRLRAHSFTLWSTQIHKTTIVKDPVEFRIASNPVNHQFVIKSGEELCVTGYAKIVDDTPFDYELGYLDQSNETNDSLMLTGEEFYTEMSIRGLTIKPKCQAIDKISSDGSSAQIRFNGNWITFIESCLLCPLLADLDRCLKTITTLEWFRCDPVILNDQFKVQKQSKNTPGINLIHNDNLKTLATRGLIFKVPVFNSIPRSLDTNNLHHRYQMFLPYFGSIPLDHVDTMYKRVSYLHSIEKMLTALDNPQDWINVPTMEDQRDVLLNILWKTYKHPRSHDYLRDQFSSNKAELNQDRLLYDPQTQLLSQHLSIFEENAKSNGTINISSFGVTGYPFQDICQNHFRRIRNRYSFIDDLQSIQPIKTCDLIIYNHESMALLPTQSDEDSFNKLRTYLSSMDPSSFVIIQCRKALFPVEYKLASYIKQQMIKAHDGVLNRFKKLLSEENFILISEYTMFDVDMVSLLARKKMQLNPEKSICHLKITSHSYQWINSLQRLIEKPDNERIWLIFDETDRTGIIGLINSLKEEQFGSRVKCIFSPNCKIDLNSDLCEEILAKDLVINVYIDQTWGSYRHFELSNDRSFVNHKQVYLDWSQVNGEDETTKKLVWCKFTNPAKESNVIINHFGPLNFTLKFSNGLEKHCRSNGYLSGVGNEFAGQTKDGIKVFGLCASQGISNIIPMSQVIFSLPVPTNWNLKDAAAIVMPYTIAYYSLILRGSLTTKCTVLLHNLTDGLFESSAAICNSFGCRVFIAHHSLNGCSNYLQDLNGITMEQILSPENDLMKQIFSLTNGQGVDFILTMDSIKQLESLANCLKVNGKLIQLISNEKLEKEVFEPLWLPENASLESICWSKVLKSWTNKTDLKRSISVKAIVNYFEKGLINGQIKPITKTSIYSRQELPKAINQLSSSLPLGRSLIKLINNDEVKTVKKLNDNLDFVPCEAQTTFDKNKCYIIFGGLGGIGLQLGQWIVEHGGRNIVMVSRKGVTKNYQKFILYRMKSWPDPKKSVQVNTINLPNTNYEEVFALIQKVQSECPIGGIFNLAGTLASGLFENQTVDNFTRVCSSKVELTEHLDFITRSICPSLDYFVCFSSIGSTGILGESNYCYANSYMERICESRRLSGLAGCAIQFGAVGDVGMAQDNSLTTIAGSVCQPIFSCFQALNKFLQLDYPVMYSAISAEKQSASEDSKGGFIQRIEHILGLQNLDSLDLTITLGDLGLDSLQSIEVKDLIDKTFGISLQNIAIGKLSIASLLRFKEEFQDSKNNDGKENKFTEEIIINLTEKGTSPVFFFPPALFDFLSMKALAEALKRTVIGVDLTDEVRRIGNLPKIAEFYSAKILEKYPDEAKYYFVGYSYGCLIAFEVAKVLQRIVGKQRLDCLCFIDATPYGLKRLGQITTKAALLGLPGSEVFCIAMDHLGVHTDESTRQRLLEAEDDDERYLELVSEIMASAGMNGPAEGLLHNPVANIDRGYYLTHMDDLGKFEGDALFIRVLSKTNHGKPSTVCEGLSKIITGQIKEVLYNASHFDVLKVYAKEIARDIEEMMPPDI